MGGIRGLIVAAACYNWHSTPENGEAVATAAAANLMDLRRLVELGRIAADRGAASQPLDPEHVSELRALLKP